MSLSSCHSVRALTNTSLFFRVWYLVYLRNLPFALAPLERRFVLDGAALIRSWRGAVSFCEV